jgi:hypothetical protein
MPMLNYTVSRGHAVVGPLERLVSRHLLLDFLGNSNEWLDGLAVRSGQTFGVRDLDGTRASRDEDALLDYSRVATLRGSDGWGLTCFLGQLGDNRKQNPSKGTWIRSFEPSLPVLADGLDPVLLKVDVGVSVIRCFGALHQDGIAVFDLRSGLTDAMNPKARELGKYGVSFGTHRNCMTANVEHRLRMSLGYERKQGEAQQGYESWQT